MPSTRKEFNRKAIVRYKDAPESLRKEMEQAMDALDRTPDKMELVRSFGAGIPPEVALGAASELMRRYGAEYIPQARRDFRASGDPEDGEYLSDVLACGIELQHRIADLRQGIKTASPKKPKR